MSPISHLIPFRDALTLRDQLETTEDLSDGIPAITDLTHGKALLGDNEARAFLERFRGSPTLHLVRFQSMEPASTNEYMRNANALFNAMPSSNPNDRAMFNIALQRARECGCLDEALAACAALVGQTVAYTNVTAMALDHHQIVPDDLVAVVYVIIALHDFIDVLRKSLTPAEQLRLPQIVQRMMRLTPILLMTGRVRVIAEKRGIPHGAAGAYDDTNNTIAVNIDTFDKLFAVDPEQDMMPAQVLIHEMVHVIQDAIYARQPRHQSEAEAHAIEILYVALRTGERFESLPGLGNIPKIKFSPAIDNLIDRITNLIGDQSFKATVKSLFVTYDYRVVATEWVQQVLHVARSGQGEIDTLDKVANAYAGAAGLRVMLGEMSLMFDKLQDFRDKVRGREVKIPLRVIQIDGDKLLRRDVTVTLPKDVGIGSDQLEYDQTIAMIVKSCHAIQEKVVADDLPLYTAQWQAIMSEEAQQVLVYLIYKKMHDPTFEAGRFVREVVVPFYATLYRVYNTPMDSYGIH